MTYHSSSDVPVPYGRVVLRPNIGEKELGRGGQVRDFYGDKTKGVALLASNCGGVSGRYNYLDKYDQPDKVELQ